MKTIAFLLFVATASATSIKNVKYISNHDGDTITFELPHETGIFKRMPVRVYGIDTPEIRTKNACEKAAAVKAQKLVADTLKSAKQIDLVDVSGDKYFRLLAEVVVDGVKIREVLLKNKLPYPYFGETKKKVNWCTYEIQ